MPLSTRPSAIARPRPLAAPVTIATFRSAAIDGVLLVSRSGDYPRSRDPAEPLCYRLFRIRVDRAPERTHQHGADSSLATPASGTTATSARFLSVLYATYFLGMAALQPVAGPLRDFTGGAGAPLFFAAGAMALTAATPGVFSWIARRDPEGQGEKTR